MVDEGGGPPEVDEVVDGDVGRVGPLLVDGGEGVELALDGVEVGVAEVAVGEGVRGGFEPDDDGVHLSEGADEGVVDVVVDDVGGEGQGGRDVDGVGDPDELPGRLEFQGLVEGGTGGAISLFDALARGAGLLGGDQLDEVGNDEVAGDEKVEEEAQLDVVSAEIMAADADEDAVLRGALVSSHIW